MLRIDTDLAAQTRAERCPCGGVLHRANYPRKPRGCSPEVLAACDFRFSFCCNRCRKRKTAMSVRFLGRRVYLALTVVLKSIRAGPTTAQARLCTMLDVPLRTIQRWRAWWLQIFPSTGLWQAECARFMPPASTTELPAGLVVRFTGSAEESMARLLAFLSPLSVQR